MTIERIVKIIMRNADKLICQIGPGKDMPGGMLSVIEGYLKSPYMKDFNQVHIATASSSAKIKTFFSGIRYYITLLSRKKVKITHIHMSERGSCYRTILLVFISNIFKVPVIVHSHGGEIKTWYSSISFIGRYLFNYAMRKTQAIIVLTPGWINFWEQIVKINKIHVLPNYVCIKQYKNRTYFQNNVFNVAYLGYICEKKGTYDLIKAIKILKDDGINICLRIGGNGEEEHCRKIIEHYSLQDEVVLYGWLNQEEKEHILEISDCLVLASHFESFGIVILEAMANQIPVICGSNGYSKEIINDHVNGLVATSGNPNSIAQCLKELMNEEILKEYGEAAYMHVKNKYSEKVIITNLLNLYKKIMK